jgi:hypothetical protein
MSIESIAACLHHSKATGSDKLVLLGIANHDGDGGAWPSVATLAKYANISERSVQTCIQKLINMGEIVCHVNKGGNSETRGDRRPNRYDILVRCPNECDGSTKHRVKHDAERGEPDNIYGVNLTAQRGDTGFTLTIHEPSLEPSLNTHASFDAEVHDACNLLADLIEGNGSKRPEVTDRWLRDMERLHRIDKRSWEQITKAIHWCQDDDFWRANILSPAKLRIQYDQLRLAAQRTQQKQSPATGWLGILNRVREQDQLELEQ